jgi:UDP-N-acetylglucosamine 4,6-dehydratase/UDP-glucose 4-epimerase
MSKKKILITGATGFIGKILLKHLYNQNCDITLTSRSLKDLEELKNKFPKVLIFSGDLMDISFVDFIVKDVDEVYHLAGYKFVKQSESNIIESVNGNIIVTNTLLSSQTSSKKIIRNKIISTNKTKNIRGVYGATKFISERLAKEFERKYKNIKVEIIYLTNIFNSPGSIGDIWKKSIENNKEIIITDPECTRFFLTQEQAISLLKNEEINFEKIKAVKLLDLLEVLIMKYNRDFNKELICKIGLNESEEMHEFFPSIKLPSNLSHRYSLKELYEIL